MLKLINSVFGWEETVGKWRVGNGSSFGFIFLGFLGNQMRGKRLIGDDGGGRRLLSGKVVFFETRFEIGNFLRWG